jgi:hypothetical protein
MDAGWSLRSLMVKIRQFHPAAFTDGLPSVVYFSPQSNIKGPSHSKPLVL